MCQLFFQCRQSRTEEGKGLTAKSLQRTHPVRPARHAAKNDPERGIESSINGQFDGWMDVRTYNKLQIKQWDISNLPKEWHFLFLSFFAKENLSTKKSPSELVISCRTEQPLASHRTQGTKCDVTSFNYENKCHIINNSWCTSTLRPCELRAPSCRHLSGGEPSPLASLWGNWVSVFKHCKILAPLVFWHRPSLFFLIASYLVLRPPPWFLFILSVFPFVSLCQPSPA